MNITIIGASAGVGLEAVKIALERSHQVTTLSRSEISLPSNENLTSLKGSATNKTDLKKSLEEVFAHKGPALINIFTDANALAMPPNITFDQVSGMTESLSKMMFSGNTTEVVDIMKSGAKYLREIL